MNIEIIGIIASVILICAVSFRSTTPKRNILMRLINIVGSALFVVYGFMIPAYSTAGLNIAIIIVNIIYITLEWRKIKANETLPDTSSKKSM